ncbi:MAG: hypothetical protein IJY08_04380 [Clostridia bacterium]|nr:hypothetical protein [Clostridia bacterium]
MRKKITRFLCGGLACLTLLGTLVACSNDDTPPVDTSNNNTVSTDADGTDWWAELPKNNYGGATFTILQPKEQSYEFAEGLTGDKINDAVYKRDIQIESTYGVDLVYMAEPGNWTNKSTFISLVRDSIMAEDDAYQLVNGMTSIIMPLTIEGQFYNYGSLEGMDFSNPWWSADIYNNLQIADRLYAVTGSSMLSVYKGTYVMYANTALIEQRKLTDPVELVLSGKWTLENFLKLTREQGEDINSDEQMTEVDFYGFISSDVTMRGFQTAFDLNLIDRSSEGKLVYKGATQRYYDAVDKFKTLVTNPKDTYILKANDISPLTSIFAADRAIILNETIETAETLATLCDDYVILPQPKYNEEQTDYYVQMGTSAGMFVIPITSDADMVVDIINAHGCLSYLNVVPEYYEDTLKTKYVQVPENMEIIDLINRSIMLDVTYAHNYTVNKYQTEMFCMHTYGGTDAASHFAKFAPSMNGILDGIYSQYAALD